MALDFPANPNDGDTYNHGSITWTYSNVGGWSRAASTIGNDEFLKNAPTADSLTVGLSDSDILGMTGVSNTLVGKKNGTVLGTGAGNTILGAGAGEVLIDGNDNTLLGKNAGVSLGGANANDNVFIGSGAQRNFSQALDCVIIGKDASTLATNENDAIVIGAGAKGKGAGTAVIGNVSTCTDTHLSGTLHITGVSAGDWLKVDADGESVIASPVAISKYNESITIPLSSIGRLGSGNPAGTIQQIFRFPYNFTVASVSAYTRVAVVTQNSIFDIHDKTDVSIMNTDKLIIEVGEFSTKTATTQPALTTTVFLEDDLITIQCDQSSTLYETFIILTGFQT